MRAKQPNPGCDDRSAARLLQPMPTRCPPECPDSASAKGAEAFNPHSPDAGGSGLAQHVLRSPARTPSKESRTGGPLRRAAKRKTLYVIPLDAGHFHSSTVKIVEKQSTSSWRGLPSYGGRCVSRRGSHSRYRKSHRPEWQASSRRGTCWREPLPFGACMRSPCRPTLIIAGHRPRHPTFSGYRPAARQQE